MLPIGLLANRLIMLVVLGIFPMKLQIAISYSYAWYGSWRWFPSLKKQQRTVCLFSVLEAVTICCRQRQRRTIFVPRSAEIHNNKTQPILLNKYKYKVTVTLVTRSVLYKLSTRSTWGHHYA